MSFIEEFLYCVLITECPVVLEVPLYSSTMSCIVYSFALLLYIYSIEIEVSRHECYNTGIYTNTVV